MIYRILQQEAKIMLYILLLAEPIKRKILGCIININNLSIPDIIVNPDIKSFAKEQVISAFLY